MLAVHAVVVLGIASAFHYIDSLMSRHKYFWRKLFVLFRGNFFGHCDSFCRNDHLGLPLCCPEGCFPTNPQTFFFAGEMYTTVGYGNYKLTEQWRILPIIISFTGIFAVSMSGAALYTMMGALINKNKTGS
jgi:hypothetical protein